MIQGKNGWFVDDEGRTLILRGCNLGGDCKTPYRPRNELPTREEFYDYGHARFTGRPFTEAEAPEHLDRLVRWGFNVVRLLVTWEGLQPAEPGKYDEAYYDYVERIAALTNERGLRMFIDPHQDVWSRWTGGDGAPAWTLDLAGFEPRNLHRSGAAYVHEEAGDPYPRMLWSSNYSRLATATMFTLFFAGDDFAPHLKMDGQDARGFLQGHYIDAIARLAGRLAKYNAVIGIDSLNEPSDGFIGLGDLSRMERSMAKNGPIPTPFEGMMAASGYPVEVDVYGLKGLSQGVVGRTTLGEHGVSAWKKGSECVWLREGVWDLSCGKPVLLKPDYFSAVRGKKPDFVSGYLKPFARRVGEAVSKASGTGRYLLFIETVPNAGVPTWNSVDTRETGMAGAVNATHWYDGVTLFLKRWFGFLAYDPEEGRLILGPGAVRRYFARHLGRIRKAGTASMNGAPSLIGEFGLPYDLNGAYAYRNGNYRLHVKALSAYYDAMDKNLLSSTIWNYTASNTHARGDGWNGEDLSIWCRDDFEARRTETGDQRDSGGRALAGVVRPYARSIAGVPLSMRFKRHSKRFELVFKPDIKTSAETEIYIPELQYPNGFGVTVTGGSHRLEDHDGYTLVLVTATSGASSCIVTIK